MYDISQRHWYVAYVKSCQEKKVAESLSTLGVEYYLPVQKVKHKWSDRWKVVTQLILPRLIFIRPSDESERIDLLNRIYGLIAYLPDRGSHRPAIVPDTQMHDFMLVVSKLFGGSDYSDNSIEILTDPIMPGDMVHVVSGPLAGMDFECVRLSGKEHIVVRLGILGAATVEIDPANVIKKSAR